MHSHHVAPYFSNALKIDSTQAKLGTPTQLVISNSKALCINEHTVNQVLHQNEMAILARRKKEAAKQEYLASRYLIKYLICQYNAYTLSELETRFNLDTSKLEVFYLGQRLPYSIVISHSHNWVAVYVTPGDNIIGLDIERQNQTRPFIKLATHFYHEFEISLISKSDNTWQTFYRIWTLKEALAKATCTPIARLLSKNVFDELANLHSFSTHFNDFDVTVVVATGATAPTLYYIDIKELIAQLE